jgi:hypothetical protein
MNNHLKKIISIKGVIFFVLLFILTASTSYVKDKYLDYIEVSTLKSSSDVGIISIKHSFIGGLILSGILVVLYKIIISRLINPQIKTTTNLGEFFI